MSFLSISLTYAKLSSKTHLISHVITNKNIHKHVQNRFSDPLYISLKFSSPKIEKLIENAKFNAPILFPLKNRKISLQFKPK